MNAKKLFVNALTFLRVPLIFAWFVLALLEDVYGGFQLGFWACAAMLLSGLTDLFDGQLARRWRVVSPLGKMADPLMDKVFYVVAFPALAYLILRQGESNAHALLMMVFAISYLLRDLWVTFMRSVATMFGGDVAAMWLGKVRTALSFPMAGAVYLYLILHRECPAEWAQVWLMFTYAIEWGMLGLNFYSLVVYTRAYLPYLRRALEQHSGDGSKVKPTRGKFLSFEGGEGSGKSTQILRIKARLERHGIEVVTVREPGGTILGEKVRTLLKDENADPPRDRTELLLFLAARAQLVDEVVLPALSAGKWVLSDRFSDSTFAYQGYGRGLPLIEVANADKFATGGLKPDRTLLLKLPTALALARREDRERSSGVGADRIERAGERFHAALNEGFMHLAAAEPNRIVVIDAAGTPEEVEEAIWKSVAPLI